MEWAAAAAGTFGNAAVRRIGRLANAVYGLGRAAFGEVVDALRAIAIGQGKNHFVAMADRVEGACWKLKDSAKVTFGNVAAALKADPSRGAVSVLAGALGFLAGSGGGDANGGLPDTDIPLLGIGAHRSLFTHSILVGVAVETSVVALIDLNRRIHSKLPREHDPFWDNLLENSERIGTAFTRGASGGIAYHLFVDATFQPGAYHGLAVAMPMGAHQAILMTNSIAEGLDAARRGEQAYAPRTKTGIVVESAIEAAPGAIFAVVKTPYDVARRFFPWDKEYIARSR